MQVAVAQAYYQSGNNKEAARMMNELLDRGGVPKEQQLLLVVSACQKVNDNNCVSRAFEKLVVNYPKPDYWSNLMVALRNSNLNDLQQLNVMRLGVHVKVLKRPDEYKEMAQLGLEEKLACESQSVLETGFTNKIFVEKRDVDVNTRLLAAAKKECAVDKAALPANEASAKAAASGDALVKVGAQYLAAGDPAKAVAAIQAGITKGNLSASDPANQAQRSDEAYILLGIAQLRSNNKPEAAKAFNTVKKDPTMVRIAKLWVLNTRA
jgi:Tfp pilus assembly protein PilF